MKLNDLLNSDKIYQSVYFAKGSKAGKYLSLIKKEGPHEALRDMLINLPRNPEATLPDKPWNLFQHTHKIGDYILYWDGGKKEVGVVELGRTGGRDY